MFDKKTATVVKNTLPKFDLASPCNVARLPDPLAIYLEHYGFFDTLKEFEGDYYWGMQALGGGSGVQQIATHYWVAPEARGTIVFVHGLFDHIGLFQKLVRYCLVHKYSLFAIDLPGHGLSEGEPTSIGSFFDYAHIMSEAMAVLPSSVAPVYGVGQSTGAAVLMAMTFDAIACDRPAPFERLVFMGPLIRPCRWRISRFTLKLLGRLLNSIHRDMSMPNSHDEEFHSFLRYHDPLQSKRLAVSWVQALDEWVNYCAKAPRVDTPLLIVQGTGDRVVAWRHNVPLLQKIFTCNQVNYIKGAMHHLGNEAEPWRKTVYTSVTQFLKQRAVRTA